MSLTFRHHPHNDSYWIYCWNKFRQPFSLGFIPKKTMSAIRYENMKSTKLDDVISFITRGWSICWNWRGI